LMALPFVPLFVPLYGGWFRDELIIELKRADEAIKASAPGVGQLIGASENGKSVSFAAPTDATDTLSGLRVRKQELLTALAFVDDDYAITTNQTTARMRC